MIGTGRLVSAFHPSGQETGMTNRKLLVSLQVTETLIENIMEDLLDLPDDKLLMQMIDNLIVLGYTKLDIEAELDRDPHRTLCSLALSPALVEEVPAFPFPSPLRGSPANSMRRCDTSVSVTTASSASSASTRCAHGFKLPSWKQIMVFPALTSPLFARSNTA